MSGLTRSTILRLFDELNTELATDDVLAELSLVGGAVMTLVYETRAATKDMDALFRPVAAVRAAARRVALYNSLADDWLNDAAKGYFSARPAFSVFLERSHLRVFVATPEYLFAMKALAMRLGPEFADEADLRYLIRSLGLVRYEDALRVIDTFYPISRLPQKTFFALEELFEDPR
jgi:Nucleotidyltransferase of unknown function (DUF6036)